jgi:hypothetical protein
MREKLAPTEDMGLFLGMREFVNTALWAKWKMRLIFYLNVHYM